jgi:hypothetical protein
VGNFGDGAVNAYSTRGRFLGRLRSEHGGPIVIPGLWGLTFVNGVFGDRHTLVSSAGPGDEKHGLVGAITAHR